MQTEQQQDDWIEWAGGECPVEPCVVVDVRCRDGYEARNEGRTFSAELNDGNDWWSHTQAEEEGRWGHKRADDIIAYRVVSAS